MIKEHLYAQLSQAVHSSKADRLKRHFFLVSSALIGRLNYKHRRSYIHTASQARKTKEKWPKINILVEWALKKSPSQFVNKEACAPKMEENKNNARSQAHHKLQAKTVAFPHQVHMLCFRCRMYSNRREYGIAITRWQQPGETEGLL